ncbi:Protein of unknown function [Gryllus bimaculatus]|nr:Protein of unknown function [Gryllus bimaculatus]
MHVRVALLLLLGLLVKAQGGRPIRVQKCCAQYEVLAGDGQSCVETDWGRNASSARRDAFEIFLAAPLDEEQVRPWLPQGLPVQNITVVVFSSLRRYPNTARVNSSSLWEQHKPPSDDAWKREVVFLDDQYIARPRPWAGHRSAKYCVDAALPPLQPFLLFFKTQCTDDECISKCCGKRQVLVNKDGFWQCENDPEGYWSPIKSSLRKVLDIDPEFPYEEPWVTAYALWCTHHRRASLEDRPAGWARYELRHFLFSSWKFCVDHYRDSSALHEGLFYCEHPRIARGIYWLLRPLCVVSALLLAVALLSIACDSGMRRKVHGWCLAHHALCLFGFNMGQVVYYLAISDEIDMIFIEKIPADLQRTCTYLVKLYLKMLLMTGFVEIVSEIVMWSTTKYLRSVGFQFRDYYFPYRCTGFVADFVRAACVAWLASPEGGYLRLVRQRLRAANQ